MVREILRNERAGQIDNTKTNPAYTAKYTRATHNLHIDAATHHRQIISEQELGRGGGVLHK